MVAAHKTACALCGEDDPVVLQLHHRDPAQKRFNISSMAGRSERQVLDELAKCACLCANCHLRVHAGTGELPDAAD